MTFPALVFSFFVATMFASLLHLWRGGSMGRLVLYLISSCVGFFAGHFIAGALGINFLDVGTIHLGMGILGSLLILGLVYWLSLVDLQNE
jgi:hypothetical protein